VGIRIGVCPAIESRLLQSWMIYNHPEEISGSTQEDDTRPKEKAANRLEHGENAHDDPKNWTLPNRLVFHDRVSVTIILHVNNPFRFLIPTQYLLL
jgi:hypothetical protein